MLDQIKAGLFNRVIMAAFWAALGAVGALAASVYPAAHAAFCGGP